MACGVAGDDLMLRLGAEGAEAALRRPSVRPMDFTGRAIKGMVFVAPQGLRGAQGEEERSGCGGPDDATGPGLTTVASTIAAASVPPGA